MYKKYFQNYLSTKPIGLNFSTSNKEDLPDFSYNEFKTYLDDSESLSRATNLVTKILKISNNSHVLFLNNTNETITKFFEIQTRKEKIKILTTDSELIDLSGYLTNSEIVISKISVMPFDNFNERLIQLIQNEQFDIIFLSHVFYNSGMIIQNLQNILKYINFSSTQFILDGNRGFLHRPVDLSIYENKIYYFASAPDFFGNDINVLVSPLPLKSNSIPNTIHRLRRILELFEKDNLNIEDMNSHIYSLQKNFREVLLAIDHFYLAEKNIINTDYSNHGHFYCFALPNEDVAKRLVEYLENHHIKSDQIGSRLKFTFKLYQKSNIDLGFLKDHRKL